jgi:hypothetical protein
LPQDLGTCFFFFSDFACFFFFSDFAACGFSVGVVAGLAGDTSRCRGMASTRNYAVLLAIYMETVQCQPLY